MGKGQNCATLRQPYNGLTWLKLYDPVKADIFLVVASLHPKVLDEVMTGIMSVFLQAKSQRYTRKALFDGLFKN